MTKTVRHCGLWGLLIAFLVSASLLFVQTDSSFLEILLISLVAAIPGAIAGALAGLQQKRRWLRFGLFGGLMMIAIGALSAILESFGYFAASKGWGTVIFAVIFPLPAFVLFSLIGFIVTLFKNEHGSNFSEVAVVPIEKIGKGTKSFFDFFLK
jgi:hypothetical protein